MTTLPDLVAAAADAIARGRHDVADRLLGQMLRRHGREATAAEIDRQRTAALRDWVLTGDRHD